MGRRSNRTPFSYPDYRRIFRRHFEYSDKPEDADFLVFGLAAEIRDNLEEVGLLLSRNPNLKLVVISEEPLWDTLWGSDFTSKEGILRIGKRDIRFTVLNHFSTRIFDFEKIPYFLTTSDDFFARYSFLFARNQEYKGPDLKALWERAPVRAAFYAERRLETNNDFQFKELDVWGLSRYRTLVAEGMQGEGIVRVGRGWGDGKPRQRLPDWHLDKLAALDRQAFLVSGLENTHQWNYVSEKIFDAYAILGVPLFFAGEGHGVMRMVPPGSFVNLYGLTVEEAIERITSFEADKYFLESYCAAQSMLAEIFSAPVNLVEERRRVVAEVVAAFEVL